MAVQLCAAELSALQMCQGVCGGECEGVRFGGGSYGWGKGKKRKGIVESPRIKKGGNGEEDGEGKNRGNVGVPEV